MNECLGFEFLGLCAYDPADPAVIYFSVGDAIAVLSIALVLPQFLKPIFVFRLNSRRLPLRTLYILVFLGVMSAIIGALLPSLPVGRSSLLAYPIFWELVAAVLFLVTYGALACAVVWPTRIRVGNVVRFVHSGARMLSEASPRDHIDFAQELEANFVELVRLASFDEWPRDATAFYDFIHHKKLEAAAFSRALLRLVADDAFCASLVTHSPWLAARMLTDLAKAKISRRSASPFVQALATHAIVDSSSMMAREIEFGGFGVAPVLSDSLFSHAEIIRTCEPFQGLWLHSSPSLTAEMLRRLNAATEKALVATLDSGHYWEVSDFFHVGDVYKSAMLDVAVKIEKAQKSKTDVVDDRLLSELTSGICKLIKTTRESLGDLPAARRVNLYAKKEKDHEHHIVEAIAELAYDSLAMISNGFDGDHYPSWHFALEWMDASFGHWHHEGAGMDPLQQRIAIKLLAKVRENMKGWYPAISRPLIAVMDPLGHKANPEGAHPYRLLEEMLFCEWQKFTTLAAASPEKLKHYLPTNIRYDKSKNCFHHRYASGDEQMGTDLNELPHPAPSPFSSTSLLDRDIATEERP